MQTAEFPRAGAVAKRLDVVAHTGSTNADLLAAAARHPDAYPHLSVLLTDDQRAGRGRLDRTWTAPAGAALAISVLVRVPQIAADSRGWVPLIAGAAMTLAVRAHLEAAAHPEATLVEAGAHPETVADLDTGPREGVSR